MNDEMINLLADALACEPEEVESHRENVKAHPSWDSLVALGVMVLFDERYGINLTGDQLKAMKTVDDFVNARNA